MAPLADVLNSAGDAGSVVGAVLTALALAGAARGVWRRTIGRRRDLARRLRRLGCGAQLSFFQEVLGEPPTMRQPYVLEEDTTLGPRLTGWRYTVARLLRRNEPPLPPDTFDALNPALTECLWVYPECYVQAFVDAQDSVQGFSVTTRDRVLFKVRLGRTRLSQAVPDTGYAPTVRAWLAARAWQYADLYYFGNPGYYLTFVAASSYAGNPRHCGELQGVIDEIGYTGWPPRHADPGDDWPEWGQLAAVRRFREATTVTTYAVIAGQHIAERVPCYGPHGDEVRMLLGAR